MTAKYRAVLVGLGNIAWKLDNSNTSSSSLSHAGAFKANPLTTIVGGFSPVAEERQAFKQAYHVAVFDNLECMLNELKPDIVSICSPTELHFEQSQICLAQHVPMLWLEKPPAKSTLQCMTLEQLRKKSDSNTQIVVNYQRRYTQSYINLRNLLDEAHYGKILFAEIKYSRGLETNGSHLLDLIFFLFGKEQYDIDWVSNKEGVDNLSAVLRFCIDDSDVLITICGIKADYHCIDVSVTCEKARLSVLHGGMTPKIEEVVEHELFPGYYRLKETSSELLGEGGFDYAFDKALGDLIGSYEQGRLPKSHLISAYLSMQLLEKLQEKGSR